jgi:hypothetical protein
VCHVSVSYVPFKDLLCQLECDMCHPPYWATCPLLVFRHVALPSSMPVGAPDGLDKEDELGQGLLKFEDS